MYCNGCGRDAVVNLRMIYDNGAVQQSCENCGGIRTRIYDVWCPAGGYFDENLSHPDKPETWGGVWIPDKPTKARILKEYGLKEDGDRKSGSRAFDPTYHKHAMKSLERR
jgi:hypothetical protein